MTNVTNWDELITEDATKWPVASTTSATETNPDKFVRRYNVPVLQTHKRVIGGDDVVFDVDKLRDICAYCNKRIRDTGDYAAICIGHTRKGQEPPPVVGFAGPFRLGWLNDEKTTPAILADFRIYADKEPLLEQYPRRSPELMYDADFQNIYLDPIALLGGETPWADLGTCYEAGDGRKADAVKYEACAAQVPGGYGNPFETKGRKKVDYQAGAQDAALTPELQEVVRQLQEAIFESPEMKFIRSKMQADAAALDAQEEATEPSAPAVDAGQIDAETQQDAEGALNKEEAGGEDGIDYGALFGDGQTTDDESEERRVDPDSLGEEEPEDDLNPSNSRGLESDDDLNLSKEEDGGENFDDNLNDYENDGDLTPVDEDFDGGEDFDEEEEEKGEEEMATNDRILATLDKINARLDRLELANARLNDQVVTSARYAALDDLRSRFVFDVEAEKEAAKYNKMNDKQFAARLDRIKSVYSETNARPFDPTRINVPDRIVQDAPAADPARYQSDRERQVEEAVARRASLNAQSGKWESSVQVRAAVLNELGN